MNKIYPKKECNAGHVEILFASNLRCPLCAQICKADKEHLVLTDKIDHLRGKIVKLEATVKKAWGQD